METSQWEYRITALPKYVELVKDLNMEGEDGWELCGIEYGCCIFKRPTIVADISTY